MTFRALQPQDFPWFDYSRYTFSLGLAHQGHDRAYLSGHTASEYDPDAGHIVVRGGMAQQTRTAWDKIGAILDDAGLGAYDVVRVTENVTTQGLAEYQAAESVRAEVLGTAGPAVNTVCVGALLRPDALIEIEVVAGRGDADPVAVRGDAGAARPAWAPARAAGGIVYLSSCQPVDDRGQLVGQGDLVAQADACFAQAARRLDDLGMTTAQVTKVTDFVALSALKSYKATGTVRRDYLSDPYPGSTGILMPRLPLDGGLIQLDIMASREPLETINPGWERYGKLTYSPAVKAGNVLFMSGQAALDPATEAAVHADDIAAQAEYTYDNILTVLRAAGAGPEHLVKTVEYVTPDGLADYRKVAAVRERLLQAPWPASTGIVCEGLLRPEFKIEVDPLALLD